MSMLPTTRGLVTVFGGSGFIGRHLVKQLAQENWRIRVACRRPNLGGFLRPLGAPGQIALVQANLRYPDSVRAAVESADAVVNLVGILAHQGKQTFEALHHQGAETIAQATKAAQIRNFVQMSSIGADPDSPSAYGRTKGLGEQAVRDLLPGANVIRPSLVFGPEDDLFNRFASMARLSPMLPFVPGYNSLVLPFASGKGETEPRPGETKFQPVYVGDVAVAISALLNDHKEAGQTFELGGPEILTFCQLLERMLFEICRKKIMVPLPLFAAKLLAKLLQYAPGKPLTPDQVKMLAFDNLVSEQAEKEGRTLSGLSIESHALNVILPQYLRQYRPAGQFTKSITVTSEPT